jgi:hypothetical protein
VQPGKRRRSELQLRPGETASDEPQAAARFVQGLPAGETRDQALADIALSSARITVRPGPIVPVCWPRSWKRWPAPQKRDDLAGPGPPVCGWGPESPASGLVVTIFFLCEKTSEREFFNLLRTVI